MVPVQVTRFYTTNNFWKLWQSDEFLFV